MNYLIQVAEVRRGIAETLETCFMLTRLEGVDVRELVTSATIEECAMFRVQNVRLRVKEGARICPLHVQPARARLPESWP